MPDMPDMPTTDTGRTGNVASVARVCRYIDANLTEHLTLTDLAGHAGLSRHYFSRLFRAVTGDSPMRYLMGRRIARAQRLLADRRHSVCEIAMLLHFADQSHFCRSFRRRTGCSPLQYSHTR
jgi:AraC family transcriptional regulator